MPIIQARDLLSRVSLKHQPIPIVSVVVLSRRIAQRKTKDNRIRQITRRCRRRPTRLRHNMVADSDARSDGIISGNSNDGMHMCHVGIIASVFTFEIRENVVYGGKK